MSGFCMHLLSSELGDLMKKFTGHILKLFGNANLHKLRPFLNSQSFNWHPLINIQGCLVIWHCENCAINQTMIACNKI